MEITRIIVWQGCRFHHWKAKRWQGFPARLVEHEGKFYWLINKSMRTWIANQKKNVKANSDHVRNRTSRDNRLLFLNRRRKIYHEIMPFYALIPFRRSDL